MHSHGAAQDCATIYARQLATWQSIYGSLYVDNWDHRLGVSSSGGVGISWTSLMKSITLAAPSVPKRPPFAADGSYWLGRPSFNFNTSTTLQIVGMTPPITVAGTRPNWIVIARCNAGAGAANQSFVSVLNTAANALLPGFTRKTSGIGGYLNATYFPSGSITTAAALADTLPHVFESFVRSSDNKPVISVDLTDDVGASAVSVTADGNTIYLASDRASTYAPINVVGLVCLNDSASPAQRAAGLAFAKSEYGF